jgi:hypothetical protein
MSEGEMNIGWHCAMQDRWHDLSNAECVGPICLLSLTSFQCESLSLTLLGNTHNENNVCCQRTFKWCMSCQCKGWSDMTGDVTGPWPNFNMEKLGLLNGFD